MRSPVDSSTRITANWSGRARLGEGATHVDPPIPASPRAGCRRARRRRWRRCTGAPAEAGDAGQRRRHLAAARDELAADPLLGVRTARLRRRRQQVDEVDGVGADADDIPDGSLEARFAFGHDDISRPETNRACRTNRRNRPKPGAPVKFTTTGKELPSAVPGDDRRHHRRRHRCGCRRHRHGHRRHHRRSRRHRHRTRRRPAWAALR